MGVEPEHKPKTQAKLLYDDENIYLIFCVEDKYIRAVAKGYHVPVWRDSCVDFFFYAWNRYFKGLFQYGNQLWRGDDFLSPGWLRY